MDRKHCILLYSNYSQASIDLLSYIRGLPLDFPKVTGMTMVCVDHEESKSVLLKNGIEYVPTLLVEYYGATPTKQKFERDYIYMWIDQVMKALWLQTPQTSEQQPVGQDIQAQRNVTHIGSAGPVKSSDDEMPRDEKIKKTGKVDITALAQQMAKDRDSDDVILSKRRQT
jgi:hypothetical protein